LAENIVEAMLSEGVYIVRSPCTTPSETTMRVTVGTEEQNRTCVDAMRKVVAKLVRWAPAVPVDRLSQP